MYRCVIIEDEPLAAELLADYLRDVPDFELVAHCRDVMSASSILRNEPVDVLFVDIHLPKIKGIDFVRSVQNQYQIILTTAYDQYAVEGFNLNVVDYLLKPIEFNRFLQALQKVKKNTASSPVVTDVLDPPFQYFNVDKKQVKVRMDDVLFVESLKEYIRIHTAQGRLVTKVPIGEAEALFAPHGFIRVHKSYIVNLQKVTAFGATVIDVEGHSIPIGRSYKELVMQRLQS
jgi:DNA-binding LytR/AlgR family response regulator